MDRSNRYRRVFQNKIDRKGTLCSDPNHPVIHFGKKIYCLIEKEGDAVPPSR